MTHAPADFFQALGLSSLWASIGFIGAKLYGVVVTFATATTPAAIDWTAIIVAVLVGAVPMAKHVADIYKSINDKNKRNLDAALRSERESHERTKAAAKQEAETLRAALQNELNKHAETKEVLKDKEETAP